MACLLVWAAWACGTEERSALEIAREQGLRAGFSTEPPYAFVDSTGRVTGEAPEILRWAAAALEIDEVHWVPLEFRELIPSLLAGRIDVIASGMFMTPERSESVRFSLPTACVSPVLVVASPARDSADCAGCRIAVLEGSVEQAALPAAAVSAGELVVVPDVATAIAALQAGSADALAISAPTGRRLAAAEPDLVVREDPFPEDIARSAAGCAAFGFRPDDEDLAGALDAELARFLGSPAHLRIIEPLGFTPRELPCPVERARADGRATCAASSEPPA